MSWVVMVSVAVLLVAVAIIEYRAIRVGDERLHRAPGYYFVMGGLVVIGIAIAAAASEQVVIALVASCVGLAAVAMGAYRHREATAH